MTDVPVWRTALKDGSHPMHNIAWYVFSENFNAERFAEKFADRRDEILPFLFAIVDAEELHDTSSLGGGFAPINAVKLFGEWQVMEAIPRLLAYLDADQFADLIVTDRAAYALEKMPPEAIEPLLEHGRKDDERAMNMMFALRTVGKGDDRAFDFLCSVFERQTEDMDIMTAAECLADNNVEKAEAYLKEKSEENRYRKYRKDFEHLIASAKADQ